MCFEFIYYGFVGSCNYWITSLVLNYIVEFNDNNAKLMFIVYL